MTRGLSEYAWWGDRSGWIKLEWRSRNSSIELRRVCCEGTGERSR
ncbi:hypothetical protein QUB60_17250 [Microcoleus sp. A2-C5]